MKIYPRSIDIKNGSEPCSFTIKNSSKEDKLLLYKVRRTDPKVVSFKPHCGVVQAGCSRSVALWLTDTQAAQAHVLVKFVAVRKSKYVGAFDADWKTGSKKGIVKKVVQIRNLLKISSEDEDTLKQRGASIVNNCSEKEVKIEEEIEEGGEEEEEDDIDGTNISLFSASTLASTALSVASTQASVSVASSSRFDLNNRRRGGSSGHGDEVDSLFSSSTPQQLLAGMTLENFQNDTDRFNLIVNNSYWKAAPGRNSAFSSSVSPQQGVERRVQVENEFVLTQDLVDSNYKRAIADVDSLFSSSTSQQLAAGTSLGEQRQEGGYNLEVENSVAGHHRNGDMDSIFSSSSPQQLAVGKTLEDEEDRYNLVVKNSFHHVGGNSIDRKGRMLAGGQGGCGNNDDDGSVISDISQYESDFLPLSGHEQSQQIQPRTAVHTSSPNVTHTAQEDEMESHDYEHQSMINFPQGSADSSPASLHFSSSRPPAVRSTLRPPQQIKEEVSPQAANRVSSLRSSTHTTAMTMKPQVSNPGGLNSSGSDSEDKSNNGRSSKSIDVPMTSSFSTGEGGGGGLVSPQPSCPDFPHSPKHVTSTGSDLYISSRPERGLENESNLGNTSTSIEKIVSLPKNSKESNTNNISSTSNETSETNSSNASAIPYVEEKSKNKWEKGGLREDGGDGLLEDIFSSDVRAQIRQQSLAHPTSLDKVDALCRVCSKVETRGTVSPNRSDGMICTEESSCVYVYGADADDTVVGRSLALRVCALLCASRSVTALSVTDCALESLPAVLYAMCPAAEDVRGRQMKSPATSTDIGLEVERDTRLFLQDRFSLMLEKTLQEAPPLDFWGWDLVAFYQTFVFEKIQHLVVSKTLLSTFVGKEGFNSFEYLESLDLSNNKIDKIDKTLDLPHLKYLNLSGNNLRSLDYLQPLMSLSVLDVSANRLCSLHTSLHTLVSLSGSLSELDMSRNEVCSDIRYVEEAALLFPLLRMFDGVDIESLDNYQAHQNVEEVHARGGGGYRQKQIQRQLLFGMGSEATCSPPPALGGRRKQGGKGALHSPTKSVPPVFWASRTYNNHCEKCGDSDPNTICQFESSGDLSAAKQTEEDLKSGKWQRLFARVRKTHVRQQQFAASLEPPLLPRSSDFNSGHIKGLSTSADAPPLLPRRSHGTHVVSGEQDTLMLSSSLKKGLSSSAWAEAPLKYKDVHRKDERSRGRDRSMDRGARRSRSAGSTREGPSYMQNTLAASKRYLSPGREQVFKHRSLLQQTKSFQARRSFEKQNEEKIELKRGKFNFYDLRRSDKTDCSNDKDNKIKINSKRVLTVEDDDSFAQDFSAHPCLSLTPSQELELETTARGSQRENVFFYQSVEGGSVGLNSITYNNTPNGTSSSASVSGELDISHPSTLRVSAQKGRAKKGGDEGWSLTFSDDKQFLQQVKNQISSSLGKALAVEPIPETFSAVAAKPLGDESQPLLHSHNSGVEERDSGHRGSDTTLERSLHVSSLEQSTVMPHHEEKEDQLPKREWLTVSATVDEIRISRSHNPHGEDEKGPEGVEALLDVKSTLAEQLAAMESVVGELALHSLQENGAENWGGEENKESWGSQGTNLTRQCGVQVDEDDVAKIRILATSSSASKSSPHSLFGDESNSVTSPDARDRDCDECNNQIINQKENFIRHLDLDSFVQLKQQLTSSDNTSNSLFPSVVLSASPQRKEQHYQHHPLDNFSAEEEASIAELMHLLSEEMHSPCTIHSSSSHPARRENEESGEGDCDSMEQLLHRLLAEDREHMIKKEAEGAQEKETHRTHRPPRSRQSRIPKIISVPLRDIETTPRYAVAGNTAESNGRDGSSSDESEVSSLGRPLPTKSDVQQVEDGKQKPRSGKRRSISPSILNLLLPVERHQCQYCSPSKKPLNTPGDSENTNNRGKNESQSPPWNHSTRVTAPPAPPVPVTNSHLSDFFHSPQPRRPFSTGGTLRSATPSSLQATPSKIPQSARKRAEIRQQALLRQGESRAKECNWVTNDDILDLLQSYHANNDSHSSLRKESRDNTHDVSFRLHENFSEELDSSPPTRGTANGSSSSSPSSSPERRARAKASNTTLPLPQSSSVLFSPHRSPLVPPREHEEMYTAELQGRQQSSEASTNMTKSTVSTNRFSSIVGREVKVGEEEVVDTDSLLSVIREMSAVQVMAQQNRDKQELQQEVLSSQHLLCRKQRYPQHNATGSEDNDDFDDIGEDTDANVLRGESGEGETEGDLARTISPSIELKVNSSSSSPNKDQNNNEDDEMDRYISWLSNQSSNVAEDMCDNENKEEEEDKSDFVASDQLRFESNLTAWRDATDGTHPSVLPAACKEEVVNSEDFDSKWKEDAQTIARTLGLSASAISTDISSTSSSTKILDAATKSNNSSAVSSSMSAKKTSQGQSSVFSPPPSKVQVQLSAPYGTPLSLARTYASSTSSLRLQESDDCTDGSCSTSSPLPLASVRHPRQAARTPAQHEDPSQFTPPSALFGTR